MQHNNLPGDRGEGIVVKYIKTTPGFYATACALHSYEISGPINENRLNPIANLLTNELQCGYKNSKSRIDIIGYITQKLFKNESVWGITFRHNPTF